ncbi:MAG: hypothetical protein K6E97_09000 [Treponema sp.]|nr:hypothetical protein [Treponema sp.]
MKKILRFFILFICMGIFTSVFCSAKKNNAVELTGYIHCTGNEPFVKPVLVTDNNKRYAIMCSDEQKIEILELQGYHIQMTGISVKAKKKLSPDEDGYLQVISWKKLNTDEQ